jgi:hypothetical protein
MTRRKTPSYEDMHQRMLEDTAALIKQPVDSLVVRFITVARMKLDQVESQLLTGGAGATVGEIDQLRGMLETYLPKPLVNISVELVGSVDDAPADGPSVCGLVVCRRCEWKPPNRDQVSICYRCGWTHGCDPDRTPRQLLPGLIEAPHVQRTDPCPSQAQDDGSGAIPNGASNIVALDDGARAALAAERRKQALESAPLKRYQPSVSSPNIGSPFSGGDNRTISQFNRDITDAYR